MIASPLRFQLVVASFAIGGALVLTESQGPRPEARPVFAFQDYAIDESSGLVDLGLRVVTTNDSGDDAVVYVVDESTGETVGRTTYTTDEVLDVEALAPGPGDTLWVGDIGDNRWSRSSVAVYALPTPGDGDAVVEAERYDLVYEGGPRDAEALLVHPVTGRLLVVSKGIFGGQLFSAPPRLSADEPNVLRPVGDVGGLVTDGAFFPGGRFVALRSYSNLTVLEADGWRDVGGMALPDQKQGEGLAMTGAGRAVLVSTEGEGSEVLEVPLSRAILTRVAEPAPSPSASPTPPTGSDPGEPLREDDLPALLGLGGGALVVAGGVLLWRRRRRG